MEIKVIAGDITKLQVDSIIVNLCEGEARPSGAAEAVDQALGGAIAQLMATGESKGKLNEISMIHTLGKIEAARVVVVGLGKQPELTPDRIRGVAAEACRSLRKTGSPRVATIAHGAGLAGIGPEMAAQAVVEGSILGVYAFRKHMTKEPESGEIKELLIVEKEEGKISSLEGGRVRGQVLAEATNFARDMVNEPANYMTPGAMAQIAKDMAQSYGLEFSLLERQQMQEMGMGGLLGVSQGSQEPPKLIQLSYKGDATSSKTLGLIGKGITFDSGGISIKPSEGLGEMKGDMAGGATVIAAMRAIAQLKPKMNVTALVPATENMLSGSALKPGDVLRAMNGKTIEIVSTDAEGRL
ncbi:MAG: M17 family peptidase N-terminal domain-containing protein, partial [Dehalococcoidia bacterium]